MARIKRSSGPKTSIEIVKKDVVDELCVMRKKTLKDYINDLIKEDMMRQGEYFSNRYFKAHKSR
jgi:hypothetical protein